MCVLCAIVRKTFTATNVMCGGVDNKNIYHYGLKSIWIAHLFNDSWERQRKPKLVDNYIFYISTEHVFEKNIKRKS